MAGIIYLTDPDGGAVILPSAGAGKILTDNGANPPSFQSFAGTATLTPDYQTNITGTTVTLPYTPSQMVGVYKNGIELAIGTDVTLSGSVLTFTTALSSDNIFTMGLIGGVLSGTAGGALSGTYPNPAIVQNSVSVLRLNFKQAVDIGANFGLSAGWNNMIGANNFTVGNSNSIILISMLGGFISTGASGGPYEGAYGLVVDGTPYSVGSLYWAAIQSMYNVVGTLMFNNLGVGVHTVRTALYSTTTFASGVFWRPASFPFPETLAIQVLEIMV